MNVNGSLIKLGWLFAWSTGLPPNQSWMSFLNKTTLFSSWKHGKYIPVSYFFQGLQYKKNLLIQTVVGETECKRDREEKDKVWSDALDLGGHSWGLQLGQWRLVTAHRLSSWDLCPWRSGGGDLSSHIARLSSLMGSRWLSHREKFRAWRRTRWPRAFTHTFPLGSQSLYVTGIGGTFIKDVACYKIQILCLMQYTYQTACFTYSLNES